MKTTLLMLMLLAGGVAHAEIDCSNYMYREARVQAVNTGTGGVRLRLQDSHAAYGLEEALIGTSRFAPWIAVELTLPNCELAGVLMTCTAERLPAHLTMEVIGNGEHSLLQRDVIVKDIKVQMSLEGSGGAVILGREPVTVKLDTIAVKASLQVELDGKSHPFDYAVKFRKASGPHLSCRQP